MIEAAPTVRLAMAHQKKSGGHPRMNKTLGPAVRFATTVHSGATSPENLGRALSPSPAVRLAHVPGAQGDNVLLGQRGVAALPASSAPALLVSYVYLRAFLAAREKWVFRDWVMDSGAHSVWRSGKSVDLVAYTEKCQELLATDPQLTEVFSLDVIGGDWRQGRKNTEYMWSRKVPAIPVYHYNEPFSVLTDYMRDFPGKIAVGGAYGVMGSKKMEQARDIFARAWPFRIHGFAFGSVAAIMGLPWHSTDATNWEVGAAKFGSWKSFGNLRIRGSQQNLRAEVEWYLKLEREAQSRWRRDMERLERECAPWPLRTL